MTPTSRSLKYLKELGYTCQVVEKFLPFAKVRVDLFGGIDIVAIKEGIPGILGIQATSTGNINARVKKLQEIEALALWKRCGNSLQVWGWGLKGKQGKRKTYQLRVVEV